MTYSKKISAEVDSIISVVKKVGHYSLISYPSRENIQNNFTSLNFYKQI